MLISMEDLRPGDIGLGPIGGFVGWIPKIGQLIVDGRSWPEHAFIVVEPATPRLLPLTDDPRDVRATPMPPRIVQAMPGGAERVEMNAADHFTTDHVFYRPAVGVVELAQYLVAAHAEEFAQLRVPYSFLDYGSIALWHWGIRPRWVSEYILNTKHMICSQLVDECLYRAGIRLFNDGRLPQDVTPAALAKQLNLTGWTSMYPNLDPN